jgi:hypothetical protein
VLVPGPFRVDAGLPERGPARWAAIAAMMVGGLVALLVPIFLAVVVWGWLTGP